MIILRSETGRRFAVAADSISHMYEVGAGDLGRCHVVTHIGSGNTIIRNEYVVMDSLEEIVSAIESQMLD